jgi:ATP-binding cassette, subfamily B, multidrug efflux pump
VSSPDLSRLFTRLIKGRLVEPLPPGLVPTTLQGQVRRNVPSYLVGVVVLAINNYCQYRIDLALTSGMQGLLADNLAQARHFGLWIMALAAVAFLARVLSRLTIFNAGRFAEYELRGALLHQLHRLGPSFYSKMTTGDIMSRVTNDLQQVRTLLGFGVLNLFNTSFALFSALAVMLQFSVKLTLASLAPLPILLLVMRHYSKQLFSRQRENQDALGAKQHGGRTGRAFVRA